MRRFILVILIGAALCHFAGAQPGNPQAEGETKLVEFEADFMRSPPEGVEALRTLVGKVVMYHNGAVITCDSAVQYTTNHLECFGNVLINQDSTYIYGDRADYDGDVNLAHVYSPLVKVVDGEGVLYTYNFQFNTLDNIGTFHGGGTMNHGENRLESERGYYYSDTRDFIFVDNVEATNPDYRMQSDSVVYNMDEEVATFFTRTNIWNKENQFLTATRGKYFNKTTDYSFTADAYILTETQEVWADTMDYNSESRNAIMRRNVQMRDEEQMVMLFGDYGQFWGATEDGLLTERPSLVTFDPQEDSLFMRADSMFLYTLAYDMDFEEYEAEKRARTGLGMPTPADSLAAGYVRGGLDPEFAPVDAEGQASGDSGMTPEWPSAGDGPLDVAALEHMQMMVVREKMEMYARGDTLTRAMLTPVVYDSLLTLGIAAEDITAQVDYNERQRELAGQGAEITEQDVLEILRNVGILAALPDPEVGEEGDAETAEVDVVEGIEAVGVSDGAEDATKGAADATRDGTEDAAGDMTDDVADRTTDGSNDATDGTGDTTNGTAQEAADGAEDTANGAATDGADAADSAARGRNRMRARDRRGAAENRRRLNPDSVLRARDSVLRMQGAGELWVPGQGADSLAVRDSLSMTDSLPSQVSESQAEMERTDSLVNVLPEDALSAGAPFGIDGEGAQAADSLGLVDSLGMDERILVSVLPDVPVDSLGMPLFVLDSLGMPRPRLDSLGAPVVTECPPGEPLFAVDESGELVPTDALRAIMPLDSLGRAVPTLVEQEPPKHDSLQRVIRAYRDVRFFRNDFQGVCDSLMAFSKDSTMHMYIEPVLWSDENQITATIIDVFTANKEIVRAFFTGEPLMVSEVEAPDSYNQVKGREMEAFFRDNDIYRNDVRGNAQSLYYMMDDDANAPNAFMQIDCANITFFIDGRQMDQIIFREQPNGNIYPMDKIPGDVARFLEGFRWEAERRPEQKDVFDRVIRPSERERYEALPQPVFPLTKKIDEHKQRMVTNRVWTDRNDTLPEHALDFIRTIENR